MHDILIDIREQGAIIGNYFKGKSLISLEEILYKFEEVIEELDYLKEEFDDYKKHVEENYRPLTQAELVGVFDSDFVEVEGWRN